MLLLVACAERPSSDAITLVLKHAKLFGDPAPFRALLDEFEKAHPGVRVRSETLPSSSDEQHLFYAINLHAASTDFDVFAMDVIWIPEFARAGWLRDLSHLIESEEDEFFAGPIAAASYRKRMYALPWFMDAGLLYYRADLLSRYGFSAPETWPELVQIASHITRAEPKLYGFVWQGKQYEGLVCNALEFIWGNGGEVLGAGSFVFDSSENREALSFMRALIEPLALTPKSVTTATEEPARLLFEQGRALFMRNWPYAWNLLQNEGSAMKGKADIAPLPAFPGHESAAALGGWQLAINRLSHHPREAEALVLFLASGEAQKALALAYGLHPTRRALYRDPQLIARAPHLDKLPRIFEKARPRPLDPHYMKLSQIMQSEFSAIISGVKTSDAALASAQEKARAILYDER